MFVAFFDVFSPKPFCMHVNRSVTKSFIFEWQCVENGSSSTIIRTSNIERRICTQYIITLISSFSNTAKTKVCWLTEPINYVNKNPHKNNNNNNTTTVSEYKWREMKKEKKRKQATVLTKLPDNWKASSHKILCAAKFVYMPKKHMNWILFRDDNFFTSQRSLYCFTLSSQHEHLAPKSWQQPKTAATTTTERKQGKRAENNWKLRISWKRIFWMPMQHIECMWLL